MACAPKKPKKQGNKKRRTTRTQAHSILASLSHCFPPLCLISSCVVSFVACGDCVPQWRKFLPPTPTTRRTRSASAKATRLMEQNKKREKRTNKQVTHTDKDTPVSSGKYVCVAPLSPNPSPLCSVVCSVVGVIGVPNRPEPSERTNNTTQQTTSNRTRHKSHYYIS